MGARIRVLLRRLLGSVALLLVFVAALLAGLLLHLDHPRARALVLALINQGTAESFHGRVHVEELDDLGLRGAGAKAISVYDPEGRRIIVLRDVVLRFGAVSTLRSAVLGSGPRLIRVDSITVGSADVLLLEDARGLSLVRAFEPRVAAAPAPTDRPIELDLPRIRIERATIRGGMRALPVVDAVLRRADGGVHVDASATQLQLDVQSLEARTLPVIDRLGGALRARAELPTAASRRPLRAGASFRGAAMEAPIAARADYTADRIVASARVGPVTPERLNGLAPGFAFREPLELELNLSGTPGDLSADAEARLGRASAAVRARGQVQPELRANVRVDVDGVDLRSIHADAPATRLAAHAEIDGRSVAGAVRGNFRLSVPRSRVDGVATPGLEAHGTYSGSGLEASIAVAEPGAPTRIELDFSRGTRSEHTSSPARAEFRVSSRVDDLRRMPRLSGLSSRGRVELRASGRLVLAEPPRVDAELDATLSDVAAGGVRVAAGRLRARAAGTLTAPALDARLGLSGVELGERHFDRASVVARGGLDGFQVELGASGDAAPTLSARGWVDPARAEVRALRAELRRADDAADLHAERLKLGPGGVRVDGARVAGVGELELSGNLAPDALRVKSHARRLDLAAVSRLVGIPDILSAGQASYDLDLEQRADGMHGKLVAHVSELSMRGVRGGSADVDIGIEGRAVTGTIQAEIDDLAILDARLQQVVLPARLERVEQLLDVTGELSLDLRANLAKLASYVPSDLLPVDRAEGFLELDLRLARAEAEVLPDLGLGLVTRQLELVGKTRVERLETTQEARTSVPWRLSDVDVDGALRVNGATGEVKLEAKALDRRGDLVRVSAATTVPRRASAVASAIREWRKLPIALHAAVPERGVASIAALERRTSLRGRISAELDVAGSLGEPEIELTALGRRLRSNDFESVRLDATAKATYAERRAEARVEVVDGKRRALWAELGMDADLPALLFDGAELDGDLDLRAGADRFPLHGLTALKDRQIAGWASGTMELENLGRDARTTARIRFTELDIGGVRYEGAALDATADGEKLALQARVTQTDGSATLDVEAPLIWGARLVPEIDESRPTRAHLLAKDFRAAAAAPFVDTTVSALDGRINAEVDARLERGATALEGYVKLDRGVVQVPAIGQELRGVEAEVELEPGGLIRLERAQARGQTGIIVASGVARVDGLSLREARLRARIPKGRELPLTLEGVSYGEASGEVELRAVNQPDVRTTRLELEVPRFHLELPAKTQHNVQELDDDPHIRSGVYLSRAKFVTLPLQPLEQDTQDPADAGRLLARVRLGNDVWIHQGTALRVKLDGAVEIDVTEQSKITGTIRLVSGRIDVQGKQFEIESGTVTFRDDEPDNPIVVATAVWQSPEDYRVFVDFRGPIKSGDLALRSEPPLQEGEILSLLLFGSPDGQFGVSSGSEGSNTAATAVGVGGGVAARGLNRALSDLTSLDVQARVDTSSGSPTPELALQVTRRLTAELGYNVGDPGPGQPQDRTFLTLDLRIRERWSVSTTIGDRGSTRWDVLWRYRY